MEKSQNLNHKIILWILLSIVFVGLITYFRTIPVSFNNENLTSALPQYKGQLIQYMDLMKKIRVGSSSSHDKLNEKAFKMQGYMNALQFKLDTTPKQNVLAITLTTMQIMDLQTQFEKHKKYLDDANKFYSQGYDKIEGIDNFLNTIDMRTVTPQEAKEIVKCRETIASVKNEILKGQKSLVDINSVMDKLDNKITKLSNYSEEKRNESFSEYFFSKGENFMYLSAYGILPLLLWGNSLPATIHVVLPSSAHFWWNFTALLIILNVIMYLFGKLYIWSRLPDDLTYVKEYKNSKILPVSFICFAFALTFFLSNFTVGTSMKIPLQQMGFFALNVGLLMWVILFRVKKEDFTKCFLLYSPLIITSFILQACYSLLIYYSPMTLILPPLCGILSLAIIILLWKNSYPIMDTTIGVFTILSAVTAGYLAFIGLPYIGFTIIMIWFPHLVQFLVALTVTKFLLYEIKEFPKKYHLNNFYITLVIPSIWISFAVSLLVNIKNTYHLSDWFNFIKKPLPLPEQICSFGILDICIIIASFFIFKFLINLSRQLVHDIYKEKAEFGKIPSFVTLGIYVAWSVYILTLLIILKVNTSSILVMIGGFSMGLGFAMRDVLENFVAGIMLLVGQHVRPGDLIEFDGILGKIKTVNFRATVVEAWDGSVITLPNTRVIDKDFKNWTRNNKSMCKEITIGVSYDEDTDRVRRILLEVAQSMPSILTTPPPVVILKDFGASSVDFVVRIWVTATYYVAISSEYREKVFEAFKKYNVNIPYNQIDIHMIEDKSKNKNEND